MIVRCCSYSRCVAANCGPARLSLSYWQEKCKHCGAWTTTNKDSRHHLCPECDYARRHSASIPLPPSPPPSPSPPPPPPPTLFDRPPGCIDQLTLVQRAAIVTLWLEGQERQEIARKIPCHLNTVGHWIRAWQQRRDCSDAERNGRPRCTTEETDQDIGLLSDQKPTSTPKDIKRELRLPISAHTISRRLDEVGLFGRVQETEHDLDEFDLQRRLAFANQYLHWTEDQWAHVFFSDETNFYLGHHGRSYVRRPVGMSHDPKYLRQEKQLHGKVSLWGCICAEGLGHAELYAGSLDSTRHRDILRHSLIPSFRQFYPAGPWFFQQDNVRFHTTPETVTYLHENGITLIEWPPWSPDLNPIENLWNVLKARVYARFPQTMEEMEQMIREEWEATDLTFISHICRSMPRRLQLLLDNQGHKISY